MFRMWGDTSSPFRSTVQTFCNTSQQKQVFYTERTIRRLAEKKHITYTMIVFFVVWIQPGSILPRTSFFEKTSSFVVHVQPH